MYLKSIDLYGFKSFADKMMFKFDKGITGIVGPNGSGKSNVADAVRWVLGEQSAKQLRGSKMEDVIFAGTQSRKPLGYCQVDITIDNHDKRMLIDFEEVTVSRRVYRSGESNYFINGTNCRLKDVQELFMDTGVGREGYSIIGQGQVDKILSTKPDDRRALFDEAAGIVKYKTKKNAAIHSLEKGEQDLERIHDIIGELETQIVVLEEQSKIAKIFLEKREDLKKYEVNSFIKLIENFEEKIQDLAKNEKIVKSQKEEKEKEYDNIAWKYHVYEKKLADVDEVMEKAREEITKVSLEIEQYQSKIALSNERIANNEKEHQNIEKAIQDIKDEQHQKRQKVHQQTEEKEKLLLKVEKLRQEIKEKEKIVESIQLDIRSFEVKMQEVQTKRIEMMNNQNKYTSNIEKNTVFIETNQNTVIHNRGKIAIHEQTKKNIGKELEEVKIQIQDIEQKQKTFLDEKLKIRKEVTKKSVELNPLKETLHKQRHEYNKLNSRIEALRDMENQYEGYFLSVKKIMELGDKDVEGVVSDVLTVEPIYELAIETALGSGLQNIITKNEHVAKKLIEYLKKNRLGRATFLPLTTVKGKKVSQMNECNGFLGIASELVTFDEKYRGIIEQLLGRVLVVENLSSGIELAKKNQHKYRIITLEGDVMNAGGSMTGGAHRNNKSQLLSRKNELDTFIEENLCRKKQIEEDMHVIESVENEMINLKEKLESITIEEQELNLTMHTKITYYKQNKDEVAKLTEETELLFKNVKEIEEQIRSYKEENKKLENALQEILGKEEHPSGETEEIAEEISVLREDAEIMLGELTEDKVRLSSMEQSIVHLTNTIDEDKTKAGSRGEQIKELKSQLQKNEVERLKESSRVAESKTEQEVKKETLQKLEVEIKEFKYERQEIQVKKGQLDSKREIAHEDKNILEKDLLRIQNNIEKQEMQKENQINYMWDEYELSYNKALEYRKEKILHDTQLKSKINKLKTEIKGLGDVNVNAIEEYQNVNERYTFLSEQRNDLLSAKEKLLTIIDDLNEQMTKQFIEKFEEINTKFHQVFTELFGGGRGYVELTDADNILASGITIVAQPPGKKLQNMMLLSGGERALTAISLLFAIQSLRPSPFCVLDEIEAALDDANVDRFATYLQKLTKQTQFIVITHRKGTMELADALYGITMQEKGISTQVSVNLVEQQIEEEVKERK